MINLPWMKTSENITISFKGGTKTIPRTNPNFDKVVQMLSKDSDATELELLNTIDLALRIKSHKSGMFSVMDGQVVMGGEKLPDPLSTRILDFADNNLPVEPLIKFWENCKLNPDPRAKTDLYKFLERNGHPITSGGNFIAYRAVNKDWKDKHTNTMDNKVGAVVKMDRALCDANPDAHCSHGLHVSSLEYASGFRCGTEEHIVEVEVNPRDVVAIPSDNLFKMRVCEFVVVTENFNTLIDRPLYDPENTNGGWDDEEEEEEDGEREDSAWENDHLNDDVTASHDSRLNHCHQERDANGRFIPKFHLVQKANPPMPKRDSKGHFISSTPKRDSNGRFI